MQMFVMNYGSDSMKKYLKKDLELIIYASNIVELEVLINEFFYSKYYRVADDLTIHNVQKKVDMLDKYLTWYLEFNQMFKIFKVKHGYKFYRYYGL